LHQNPLELLLPANILVSVTDEDLNRFRLLHSAPQSDDRVFVWQAGIFLAVKLISLAAREGELTQMKRSIGSSYGLSRFSVQLLLRPREREDRGKSAAVRRASRDVRPCGRSGHGAVSAQVR
jgi:hypothetical protein